MVETAVPELVEGSKPLFMKKVIGELEYIMEDWKEYKLSDIMNLIGGGTPKTSVPEYWDGDIPWISVKDFNGKRRFVGITEKTITQAGLDNSSTKILSKGDVIISARGTVGELAIIPSDMAFNQSCYGLRAKEFVDPTFLYYLLKQSVAVLKHNTHGSVFDTITKETFEGINIYLPPLPTQQKIAQILSSLDDKIELNSKINANLEQQAQALFKSWLVDFEPFGGEMPAGWKEADIYSIANIIYGSPFASKLFNSEKNGKPIIRIRDLKDQHSDVYTLEERDDGYLIQPKDIVVGMDGEFRPYIWGSEPGWLNQRVCVFENKRPKGKAFLYFCIKPLLDVVEKTQVATTVIHIGKKDFDKFRILLPSEEIMTKFDELTDPIIDQIVTNRLENIRLSTLRDTLLPKLMNGEIEV